MRLAIVLIAAALAGGCASPARLGHDALVRGTDLIFAEKQLVLAVQQGDYSAWYNLGIAYARQRKIDDATRAFTMAARYGDPEAQAMLAKNGFPVPPADLAHIAAQANAQAERDASEGAGILLQGLAAGIAAPRSATAPDLPSMVRCDARNPQVTVVGRPPVPPTSFDCRTMP